MENSNNSKISFTSKLVNNKNMLNKSLLSSKSSEWGTPKDFFKKLNKTYCFTLDVCANKGNTKCKRYFSKKKNGLIQNWDNERIFMNPPYGREIGGWIKKASEARGGGSCLFITS